MRRVLPYLLSLVALSVGYAAGLATNVGRSHATVDPTTVTVNRPSETVGSFRTVTTFKVLRIADPDGGAADHGTDNDVPTWLISVPTSDGVRTYHVAPLPDPAVIR